MARKIEDWHKLFATQFGGDNSFTNLSTRESIVVGCSLLDIGLAHLIEKRLVDLPNEAEEFLGLDDDGRAAAGSFGARITLALLTGVISESHAKIMRAFKGLRNKYAHKVEVSLLDASLISFVEKIYSYLLEFVSAPVGATKESIQSFKDIYGSFRKDEKIAHEIVLVAIRLSQSMNYHLLAKVERLNPATMPKWEIVK